MPLKTDEKTKTEAFPDSSRGLAAELRVAGSLAPGLTHNKPAEHRFLRSPGCQASAALCLWTNLARTIHTSL